jgi:hypothetical protein
MKSTKNETGFLSILYSIGAKPLQNWDMSVKNGHIKRLTDLDIESPAIEIIGANVNLNYITCPADANAVLGIKMPTIVLLMKHVINYLFKSA